MYLVLSHDSKWPRQGDCLVIIVMELKQQSLGTESRAVHTSGGDSRRDKISTCQPLKRVESADWQRIRGRRTPICLKLRRSAGCGGKLGVWGAYLPSIRPFHGDKRLSDAYFPVHLQRTPSPASAIAISPPNVVVRSSFTRSKLLFCKVLRLILDMDKLCLCGLSESTLTRFASSRLRQEAAPDHPR